MVKLVQDLDFTNKKAIIQKIVTKVVATKKEITVWGLIPLLTTGKVGYEPIDRNIKVPTQLPFELKLRMPKPDHGGRGYSDKYIANIQKRL